MQNRRQFLKSATVLAPAMLGLQCTEDEPTYNYSKNRTSQPFDNTMNGNFIFRNTELLEWIDKRIPEHTAQVYKQAFQELFDNCCHRLQDVPQKYTDQIQGPKTVEIINESDTNLLYLHDNTMFLEDMWDYHPIGQICVASQLLRHRELLTTNQFNIPSHQHTAFLYAGAIEMINQIYEGGMQRAFTTGLKPRTTTKYRYVMLKGMQSYQTQEIPYARPGSPWMHLRNNRRIVQKYFQLQSQGNLQEIANTGIYVSQSFLDYSQNLPPLISEGVIQPVLKRT
mgnify:FL=1